MILTRQEKEQYILDLYNQGHNTRWIAQETHTSFRDIGAILKRAAQQKELSEVQVESTSVSTQAYSLFSEGKTALEVTIALQLNADEAIEYQKQFWKLKQLDNLSELYKEVKGNIGPLVDLHRLSKANGMNTGQVINLLKIANNDLVSLQHSFEQLMRNVISLELEKQNSAKIYQELSDKIASSRKREAFVRSCCQTEISNMHWLYKKKRNLEGLVQFFEDNNETYLTIKKSVEEKVHSILSDRKMLLKLALLSLVESIRSNPDKYRSLLFNDCPSSTVEYCSQYYTTSYTYPQSQYSSQNYYTEDSGAILLEEAKKLYCKLTKETAEEIIHDYTFSIASASLLSEEQVKIPIFPKPTTNNLKETKENEMSVQLESNKATKIHDQYSSVDLACKPKKRE